MVYGEEMISPLSKEANGKNIDDLNIYFPKSIHAKYVIFFPQESFDYDSKFTVIVYILASTFLWSSIYSPNHWFLVFFLFLTLRQSFPVLSSSTSRLSLTNLVDIFDDNDHNDEPVYIFLSKNVVKMAFIQGQTSIIKIMRIHTFSSIK